MAQRLLRAACTTAMIPVSGGTSARDQVALPDHESSARGPVAHARRVAAVFPSIYSAAAVAGDQDELGMLKQVGHSVAVFKAGGVHAGNVGIKGGSQTGAFDVAMPQIVEFVNQHSR